MNEIFDATLCHRDNLRWNSIFLRVTGGKRKQANKYFLSLHHRLSLFMVKKIVDHCTIN